MKAVVWLVAAGLHPKANSTTLAVARDLADRMDYSTGHVRYALEDMPARLDLSRATVARHVSYLRELGALAWAQHGTRANVRRVLGLPGYAGTATVYAAVIPAAYDHAMGHTVIGSGYRARIVIDQRQQPRETPSLTLVKKVVPVQVDGGKENYTSREGASRRTDSPAAVPTKKRSNRQAGLKGSTRRGPLQVAEDIRITRTVRALVNWTQPEGLRRLAFALRPLIDEGMDAHGIAAYLTAMCLTWRPAAPAAFIRTELGRRQKAHQEAVAARETWERENGPEGVFQASHPSLVAAVVAANAAGMARLSAANRARSLDDPFADHEAAAAADIAAFLGSPA
jgi:hypothetical protein